MNPVVRDVIELKAGTRLHQAVIREPKRILGRVRNAGIGEINNQNHCTVGQRRKGRCAKPPIVHKRERVHLRCVPAVNRADVVINSIRGVALNGEECERHQCHKKTFHILRL